ncbi:MAG: DUF2797 domain-containing protein [Gammaproteobacteria bacterium]|nr:DUF2797 domain-containing protein [Gammaproteobacteria bacterium]
MTELLQGQLHKMRTRLDNPVSYSMVLGEETISLNPLIGNRIKLSYLGKISCVHCGRDTNKGFNQGYCYPCFQKLAQCDTCVMSPEKCHYDAGTCREPVWGDEFCMQDHIVYLANSSGLKVGITRASQVPTRWIDQGAIQALPIMRVRSRKQSGFAEVIFKQHVTDRTNWRNMLKGETEVIDLEIEKQKLLNVCEKELKDLEQQFGLHAISVLNGVNAVSINYPVDTYPVKVSSFNFDKEPDIEGKLSGIKGQYLILDTGVINLRRFSGYHVSLAKI